MACRRSQVRSLSGPKFKPPFVAVLFWPAGASQRQVARVARTQVHHLQYKTHLKRWVLYCSQTGAILQKCVHHTRQQGSIPGHPNISPVVGNLPLDKNTLTHSRSS